MYLQRKHVPSLGMLAKARAIHEQIPRKYLESNLMLQNSLINMYSKCGSVEEAQKIFVKIKQPNVISYTAMINALG